MTVLILVLLVCILCKLKSNKDEIRAEMRRTDLEDGHRSPQTAGSQSRERNSSVRGLIRDAELSASPNVVEPFRMMSPSDQNGQPGQPGRLAPQNSAAYQDYVAKINSGDHVAESNGQNDRANHSRSAFQVPNENENRPH